MITRINEVKNLGSLQHFQSHAGSGQRAEMSAGQWRILANRALNTLDKI